MLEKSDFQILLFIWYALFNTCSDDDNTQEDKERTVTEGEEGEEGEEKSDGLQSAWAAAGAPPPPTTGLPKSNFNPWDI